MQCCVRAGKSHVTSKRQLYLHTLRITFFVSRLVFRLVRCSLIDHTMIFYHDILNSVSSSYLMLQLSTSSVIFSCFSHLCFQYSLTNQFYSISRSISQKTKVNGHFTMPKNVSFYDDESNFRCGKGLFLS